MSNHASASGFVIVLLTAAAGAATLAPTASDPRASVVADAGRPAPARRADRPAVPAGSVVVTGRLGPARLAAGARNGVLTVD